MSDYEELTLVPLTLSTIMNMSCVNISLTEDLVIEEEEVFLVMAVSDEDVVNITSSVTVTITDITTGKYWVHVLLSLISLLVSTGYMCYYH